MTFAPTWLENGEWVRMADVPERYRGKFSVQFVHPLLVRCAIDYSPINGDGPSFRHEFTLTPDGVLATLRSGGAKAFGVTWPLLENDGTPLRTRITDRMATTAYNGGGGEQSFLALGAATVAAPGDEKLQSTYGWLRPVRSMAVDGVNSTFVFPRGAGDPSAESLLAGFHLTQDGFISAVGSVHGTLYVGRTSAGGEGASIDCDDDGKPDAIFDSVCRFVLQLRAGKILSVEADRKTTVRVGGKQIPLNAYVPVKVTGE